VLGAQAIGRKRYVPHNADITSNLDVAPLIINHIEDPVAAREASRVDGLGMANTSYAGFYEVGEGRKREIAEMQSRESTEIRSTGDSAAATPATTAARAHHWRREKVAAQCRLRLSSAGGFPQIPSSSPLALTPTSPLPL
jgi:hypothetical protein